jgi:hypothetical protein
MTRDPLPYPPQMRNGGSPLAHLFLSLDTPRDASYWLQCNWLQPPLHAPEWVIDWASCKDWPIERATCNYKQAAGMRPPLPLGGVILTGGHACQEANYQYWKKAVDYLWGDKRQSTTVDGQPQTACPHSRPHCCVGQRHGPQAPNPQAHILCGRQHQPRAPNQSTLNG